MLLVVVGLLVVVVVVGLVGVVVLAHGERIYYPTPLLCFFLGGEGNEFHRMTH